MRRLNLALFKKNKGELVLRAFLFKHNGNYKKAEKLLRDALKIELDPGTLTELGTVLVLEDKESEAIPILMQAIKMDNKNVDALHQLGIAHTKINDFNSANDTFQKAILIKQGDKDLIKSYYYSLNLQKKFQDAEKMIRRVISLDQEDSESWIDLSLNLSLQKRYTDAEKAIKKSIKLNPNNKNVWDALSSILNEQGKEITKHDLFLDFRISIDNLQRYLDEELVLIENRLAESEFDNFTKNWIDKASIAIYKSLYFDKEYYFDKKEKVLNDETGFKPFYIDLDIRRIKALTDISIIFFLAYFNISNSEILKSFGEDYLENFENNIMNFYKFDDNLKNFYFKYSSSVKESISKKINTPLDFSMYEKFKDLAFKSQEDIFENYILISLYFKKAILMSSYKFFIELMKTK
ncbi:hypothetical protein KJ885_06305 [Patescibacteria group bacterium]|nr:hypothetical protein [Patescibacteria group bacterium]